MYSLEITSVSNLCDLVASMNGNHCLFINILIWLQPSESYHITTVHRAFIEYNYSVNCILLVLKLTSDYLIATHTVDVKSFGFSYESSAINVRNPCF